MYKKSGDAVQTEKEISLLGAIYLFTGKARLC